MLSPKRRGRHPKAGRIYYTALCVVCATAVGMAAMRWPEDAYLVVLGTVSLAAASLAYLARHYQWHGWIRLHIVGMGTSYIVLMTAFYVDNSPRLPVWDRLPELTFWIVPSLIGFPLVVRAVVRHRAGLDAPPGAIERAAAVQPVLKGGGTHPSSGPSRLRPMVRPHARQLRSRRFLDSPARAASQTWSPRQNLAGTSQLQRPGGL